MPLTIRPAKIPDLPRMAELLVQDAEQRRVTNPTLWKLDPHPYDKVVETLKTTLENENLPFRQQWLVAESGDQIVGLTHSIIVPVPPIYAGDHGGPGLIMEDSFVTQHAPEGTSAALLAAAEADLVQAGAQILLASSVPQGAWEGEYLSNGYEPLTLYLGKVDLMAPSPATDVKPAQEEDLTDLVAASAVHRQIIYGLHPKFWKPHAEADARFAAWMARSLTLTDRDMFVAETDGELEGYAISQPVTPLHLPAAHSIAQTGIIDDYFHAEIKDPADLKNAGEMATDLLQQAEAARQARGDMAILVVCPADWTSKIKMLQGAGYANAITWFIKRDE